MERLERLEWTFSLRSGPASCGAAVFHEPVWSNRVRSSHSESTQSISVGRASPRSTCCSARDFLKVAAADAQFTVTLAELLNSATLHPVRWSDNHETAGGLGFFPLSFHDRDDQGQECD
jgi:hypothetical protein